MTTTLPRRHTSAMSAKIEVEAVLGGQRLVVSVTHNVEAFGVRLHQAVLDAVVDHLHEVTGAGGAAVEIALLGRCLLAVAAGCGGCRPRRARAS